MLSVISEGSPAHGHQETLIIGEPRSGSIIIDFNGGEINACLAPVGRKVLYLRQHCGGIKLRQAAVQADDQPHRAAILL